MKHLDTFGMLWSFLVAALLLNIREFFWSAIAIGVGIVFAFVVFFDREEL